jgi:hypothetical protein
MDNQHRKISGYRELSEIEILKINEVKDTGAKIGLVLESFENDKEVDQRWVAIAKTHLQQGLMALTRSIAQPTFF